MTYKVKTFSNNPFIDNIELKVKIGAPMDGYRLRGVEPMRDGCSEKEVKWYNEVLIPCLVQPTAKRSDND